MAAEGRTLEGMHRRLQEEHDSMGTQATQLQAQLDCASQDARAKAAGAIRLDGHTGVTAGIFGCLRAQVKRHRSVHPTTGTRD